jgi:class 6 POU domain transcription factor
MLSPVGEQMKALNQVPAQRTLASIPPSEMTPQYVELKAFAEEFKTKRIRLGYTQGSVGESLARKGYSNFAQSTISRFEQMQLSATNAAAIKQVLEKWLQETEFPESVTQSSSDVPMLASRKRKKRAVFMPQTKSTLDEFFRQNPRPNRQAIESMAQQLDLLPEEVRVWFCNKRQKQKQSSTSSTSSYTSAASPTSSGLVSLGSPSLSPKRRSPSPKTNFTIEELSKSSTNSSSTTSPVLHTSPFSISPTALSLSATGGVFMPVTTLPHMTVTQTRA